MRYEPDSGEQAPDVLVSLMQGIPTSDGAYRAPYPMVASSYSTTTFGAVGSSVYDAFLACKPDGTRRLFVSTSNGTVTTLYEATGGSGWTDRSKGGASYGAGLVPWSFAQNGTDTYAASVGIQRIQVSTSGAFADLSNSPGARCIDVLDGAVLAANINDAGTLKPDYLYISDVDAPTVWTPSSSNQAYQTQLNDTPGPITAMIRFRNYVAIFKRRGMWLAQRVGGTLKWDVQLYSADVGCVGKDACIVAEDILYFVDDKNFYAFDGGVIRSISDPHNVTKSGIQALSTVVGGDIQGCVAHFDDVNKVVSFYAKVTTTQLSTYLTYNTVTPKWGKADATGASGLPTPYAMVRASLADLIAFSGSGVTATVNENRYNVAAQSAIFNCGLQNGHNSNTAGAATTAYFGDPFRASTIRGVWLNSDSNTSMTVTATMKRSPRSSATTQSTSSAASFSADLIADLMVSGHFCKLDFAWNAPSNGTPADFRKWQGYQLEAVRAGAK